MAQAHCEFDVRADAAYVAEHAALVHIDAAAILAWSQRVDLSAIKPNQRPAELRFTGSPAEFAAWMLLLDSLNFCFWTSEGRLWEVEYRGRTWQRYYALVACLHRAVADDRGWLAPQRWAALSTEQASRLFAGRGAIPMLEERVRILNEIGRTTVECFAGEPMRIVEDARFDAARIAGTLANAFASFRDVHDYNGRSVAILKRAQIFAADLAEAWAGVQGPKILHLEALTAFADYRIPQVLRQLGVLRLAPGLEAQIEAGAAIISSSPAEIELRACAIHAVERMVTALASQRQASIPAWIVDEYLWEQSHHPEVMLQHHRTVTAFY